VHSLRRERLAQPLVVDLDQRPAGVEQDAGGTLNTLTLAQQST